MLNRSTIRLVASVVVLALILGAFNIFNLGSTLAANNKGAKPGSAGAQDAKSQTTPAGAQDANSQINGQLIANGTVTVNGNKAITGTTVFTESRIAVDSAKGSSAVINLGKLGRIEMVAGTKLLLRFSDGLISGELEEGNAVVKAPSGVKVAINPASQCESPVGGQEPCKVVVVHETIAVPTPTAAPVPVPVPVSGGIGGWALAGGLLGAAGLTGAAVAVADNDSNDLFVPVVSPVTP